MPDRNDPLDELRALLGPSADLGLEPAAQDRILRRLDARVALRRGGSRRRWLHGRLLALGVASLVGVSAAAAATQVLRGEPSPPGRGTLAASSPALPGARYDIRMVPNLDVGDVGWCTSLTLRRPSDAHATGGIGCGPVATGGAVITGGVTYLHRGLLAYSVVDRSVAYALTSGKTPRRLVPVDDPHLPNTWRMIVQLPGASHTGNLRFRDAAGNAVRAHPRTLQGAFARLPTRRAASWVPKDAPCSLSVPADATVRESRWVTRLGPTRVVGTQGLRACAQTILRWRLGWAEATVLIDASRPGAAPMDLGRLGAPLRGVRGGVDLGAGGWILGSSKALPRGVAFTASATALRKGSVWVVARATSVALRDKLVQAIDADVRAGG